MPIVRTATGVKHYPYTKAGMREAVEARRKIGERKYLREKLTKAKARY